MIVKVQWMQPNEHGLRMFHFYDANEAFVEYINLAHQIRLVLDSDKHDINLADGDTAYIMNNEGKTVEVIRTTALPN